ncbi:MAG: tannase/feruloyl esterase family alpha/beta hydrolase [Leptothrix sp. (in: Bacteria)]|nr:tannase/feruloyl esterase family alpha/beta hydrolase [Leptothrix sp. (in: b-proteobacteria)]
MHPLKSATGLGLIALAGLTACGGGDDDDDAQKLPQLSAASAGTLSACATLLTGFTDANTTLTAATDVAAGTLTVGGTAVPAHCRVTGNMYSRTGSNGNYAIGFEMRLPQAWNGRFFYQGNGGLDGAVSTAVGATGGGPLTHALLQGFAVISSDAGHTSAQNAIFGFDPQARLDYGYQAAQKLTPMAKALIAAAYGRGPDRSYFGGCSNGGRHTLVATTRLASQYDGFLAGAPGYNLPKAAVANIWGAQQWAQAATPGVTVVDPRTGATIADLTTALTAAERSLVSQRIVAKCDALDLAADGIVADTAACQKAFNLADDVPTCSGARDGTCLTAQQKTILAAVYTGAKTTTGTSIYNSFSYDPGIAGSGWATWKFSNSQALDPLAVGTVFGTPPAYMADPLTADIDAHFARITATDTTYTVSGMGFMSPPNPSSLSTLKKRGAKVMVYHGVSDPIFSYDDSVTWYKNLAAANDGDAGNFARLYGVPGMNHCSGGPATDQFDMLSALVKWVEQGQAPDSVVATARGTGNAGGVNAELPSSWSTSRTRPLCPYPKVATYQGSGSIEDAANFSCR